MLIQFEVMTCSMTLQQMYTSEGYYYSFLVVSALVLGPFYKLGVTVALCQSSGT